MTSQATGSRRGRPGYDRATVVRRAVDLFNERGYDATSTADLARDLGVSKSAIFHHVSSKEELLATALDEALTALSSAVDAATEDARSPGASATERLRATVAESVRILADHLPTVTLLLRVRGNSAVEQAALERRRVIDEKLAGLVREAAAEGTLRTDLAPELISRLVFGTVNSVVEWYRPGGALSPDDLAEQVTAMAFDGLAVRPATLSAPPTVGP